MTALLRKKPARTWAGSARTRTAALPQEDEPRTYLANAMVRR